MSKFLHDNNDDDDNNDAKAIAIAWVFPENSQAKNVILICDLDLDR